MNMKDNISRFLCAAVSVLLAAVPVLRAEPGPGMDDIRRGFSDIPDSVRTAVYWYWISDNISMEGVIKDLHAMKDAGIGRAFLGSMGVDGVPYGNVKFLSDEWWDITAAALKTASDLDIEIGIFNSPGWSQSGGPWVRPDQAMRYVRSDTLNITGDGSVRNVRLNAPAKDASLIKVLAWPSVKGGSCMLELDKQEGVAVDTLISCAGFPVRSLTVTLGSATIVSCTLYGGQDGDVLADFVADRSNPALNVGFEPFAPVAMSVPETSEGPYRLVLGAGGSGKVKVVLSEIPCVERYAEKSLAKMFQSPLPMWDEYMWRIPAEASDSTEAVSPSSIADITANVEDGVLRWAVPAGEWCVMAAYMVPTGVTNSPAVPEATGLEVDKMSRRHVRSHFDAYIGKILERIPQEDRRTFKVVVQDSYETGGTNWTDDMQEVFRNRYGYDPVPFLPVLSGIVVGNEDMSDRFLWDLRRLIADRVAYDYVGGLRDVCHEHGLETWLENYGHWGFPGEFLMYGGQSDQISGEFWSEGSLGDIENRAASSCGHIYGKRQIWAESCTSGGPAFSRYPRMMKQRVDRFFTEGINSTLLHLYIQQPDDRKPGLDAWFGNEFNRNNTWFSQMDLFTSYLKRCNFMLQQGRYVADAVYFIGEDAPKMTGVCDPALPYGYSFDYINAEVLMKHSRVRDGKLVLDSGMEYSVLVLPCQETMRPELLERIYGMVKDGLAVTGPAPLRSPSLEGYPLADRKVRETASQMWREKNVYPAGTPLEKIFGDLGIAPDFSARDSRTGAEDTRNDILFIHRTLDGEGDIWFISNQRDGDNHVEMSFRQTGLAPELWNPVTGTVTPVDYEEKDGRIYVSADFAPLESIFVVFRDKEDVADPARLVRKDSLALDGLWTVTFGQGDFSVRTDTLYDWSASDDDRIRYYSGTAVYETYIRLRPRKDKCRYVLDLGKVMVMAKVRVNGVAAGGVWTDPYTLDITDFLKNGKNVIEVEVVNNWMNRLVKDASLLEEERLTWTNINPYGPDSPLQPSGLLGLVVIRQYEESGHRSGTY